jgi:hypothetical protein
LTEGSLINPDQQALLRAAAGPEVLPLYVRLAGLHRVYPQILQARKILARKILMPISHQNAGPDDSVSALSGL